MSAYLVFIREKTLNQAELEIYWDKLAPTVEGHEVNVLALDGAVEVPEGTPMEGVVIAEFPTMSAAKAWHDSPAYQAVREHRDRDRDRPCRSALRKLWYPLYRMPYAAGNLCSHCNVSPLDWPSQQIE